MEKIYSRRRLRLPIFHANMPQKQWKKRQRQMKVITIFGVACITFSIVIRMIAPMLHTQCLVRAKSIATIVSNEEASKVMKDYEYADLSTIEKDAEQNIKMIHMNVIPLNEIMSNIAVSIQKRLNNIDREEFGIRMGAFTGSPLLVGSGPKIKVKLSVLGNVETDMKSEFQSAGINQTLHKIYLDVSCNVRILTPFDSVDEKITNQVLLAESVIVGNIPDAYYNLEGMGQEAAIDVMN